MVSPFCDDTGLGMLRKAGAKELVLVSTDQWLAQVSEVSRPVQCLVLSPGAVPEADGCCQSNANLSPHRAA